VNRLFDRDLPEDRDGRDKDRPPEVDGFSADDPLRDTARLLAVASAPERPLAARFVPANSTNYRRYEASGARPV
jgi:hypothetical protein